MILCASGKRDGQAIVPSASMVASLLAVASHHSYKFLLGFYRQAALMENSIVDTLTLVRVHQVRRSARPLDRAGFSNLN